MNITHFCLAFLIIVHITCFAKIPEDVKRSYALKMMKLRHAFERIYGFSKDIKLKVKETLRATIELEDKLYPKDLLRLSSSSGRKQGDGEYVSPSLMKEITNFVSLKNELKVSMVDIESMEYRIKESKARIRNLNEMIYDPLTAYKNDELLKLAEYENVTTTFLEIKRFYEMRTEKYKYLDEIFTLMIEKYQDVTITLTLAIDEIEGYENIEQELGDYMGWKSNWEGVKRIIPKLNFDVVSNLYYVGLRAEFRMSL